GGVEAIGGGDEERRLKARLVDGLVRRRAASERQPRSEEEEVARRHLLKKKAELRRGRLDKGAPNRDRGQGERHRRRGGGHRTVPRAPRLGGATGRAATGWKHVGAKCLCGQDRVDTLSERLRGDPAVHGLAGA